MCSTCVFIFPPPCHPHHTYFRQELLATLLQPTGGGGGTVSLTVVGTKERVQPMSSGYFTPSASQARGVVEPLDRALQIYTDMKNAPQAAACHYQVKNWVSALFVVRCVVAVGMVAKTLDILPFVVSARRQWPLSTDGFHVSYGSNVTSPRQKCGVIRWVELYATPPMCWVVFNEDTDYTLIKLTELSLRNSASFEAYFDWRPHTYARLHKSLNDLPPTALYRPRIQPVVFNIRLDNTTPRYSLRTFALTASQSTSAMPMLSQRCKV